MFGRSLAKSADVARARLHALGSGWVPTQQDIDDAFDRFPAPESSAIPQGKVEPQPISRPVDPPRSRVRLQPEAARGMVVLAALGVVVAVTLLLLNWPRGEAAPDVARPPLVAGSNGSATPGVIGSTPAVTGVVVVDVAGEVRRPGVRELPAGSRVIDAIDAAGGLTRRADTTALNLARVLTDGEQVLVAGRVTEPSVPGAPPPSAVPSGTVTSSTSLVSINTGTLEQLDALPGIGPVLAQAIIDYRTQNGPFVSIEQLLDVSGIGDATFADLQGLVTL